MKEETVLCTDALYKRYPSHENMWRELGALQECKSRWVQQVSHIDEPRRIIHFVFDPQARDLSSFEDNEVALLVNILPDVIRAIYHCHSNGWVHGDIKPSNILFTPRDNSVRLIDFSTSQRIGTDRHYLLHWQVTPQFSNNGQCQGTGLVTPGDDWFSLKQIITQIQEKKQSTRVISQLIRTSKWLDYKITHYKERIYNVR